MSFLYDETIVAPMLNNVYANAEANEIDFSVDSLIFQTARTEMLQPRAHVLSSAMNSKLVSFIVEQIVMQIIKLEVEN